MNKCFDAFQHNWNKCILFPMFSLVRDPTTNGESLKVRDQILITQARRYFFSQNIPEHSSQRFVDGKLLEVFKVEVNELLKDQGFESNGN